MELLEKAYQSIRLAITTHGFSWYRFIMICATVWGLIRTVTWVLKALFYRNKTWPFKLRYLGEGWAVFCWYFIFLYLANRIIPWMPYESVYNGPISFAKLLR